MWMLLGGMQDSLQNSCFHEIGKKERNSHMRFLPKKEETIAEKKGAGRAVTTQVREREKGLHYTSLGGGGRGRGIVSRVVVGAGYGR